MDESETKIGEFPPTYTNFKEVDIEHPFSIGMAAPTRAGKTKCLQSLVKENWGDTFHNVLVFSPSNKYNGEYDELETFFEGKDTFFRVISDDIESNLEKAIGEQKRYATDHRNDPHLFPKTKSLYIIDDCVDTDVFKGNRRANKCDALCERGRHIDISVILTSQVLSKISYAIRRNLTQLYVFASFNYSDIERVLEEYVPWYMRESFKLGVEDIFKTKYAFVIIDGSEGRRTQFRLRLRKGFSEYVFDPEECTFVGHRISRRRKNRPEDEKTPPSKKKKE